MAVLPDDGNITLSEQVAEIDEEFQMSGEVAGRNRLADEEIEIGVGLAWGGVEEIDGSQDMAAGVTLGAN